MSENKSAIPDEFQEATLPWQVRIAIGDIIQAHPCKTRWGGKLAVVTRITAAGVEAEIEGGFQHQRIRTFFLWGAFMPTGGRIVWERGPTNWIGELEAVDWVDAKRGSGEMEGAKEGDQ